jgi:hypothetical protein
MITLLTPHPAALVRAQKTRTLAIADLHIGWEMALSEKGIHVPTQTPRILQRLTMLLTRYKPERLLILGDVKHTVASAEIGEWHDIPEFFNELKRHVNEISIIRGNHDGNLEPLLPENVKLLPATGTTFGEVGFFHGHQWLSPMLLKCKTLIMGHAHPVVAFRDPAGFKITRQIWVKTNCRGDQLSQILLQRNRIKIEGTPKETLHRHYGIKSKASQLFIMPSFNDFLGGRPINERKQSGKAGTERIVGPVLRSEAVDFDNSEIYLLDGTFLGTLTQLKHTS